MQYSAAALAKPVRIIFGWLVRPYREVEREHRTGHRPTSSRRCATRPASTRSTSAICYAPAVRSLLALAQQIRALQNGSLRTYLAYICATLVVVLLLTR